MATVRQHTEALAAELRERLVGRRRAEAAAGSLGGELPAAVRELVDHEAAILSDVRRDELCELILRDAVGLGPLEELLADPAVEEVLVNGPDCVYVERRGRLEHVAATFADEAALRDTIERVLAPLGRRVDELDPMADARLADGSRVNVVIPPLAVDGPAISIRRFTSFRPDPDELIASGTITEELARAGTGRARATQHHRQRRYRLRQDDAAQRALRLHRPSERVVTIEDAAELALCQPHVVRLESRPASIEDRGEVTIRDLLRNALRMRPDRIVIGEVRGAEAFDLLTALNTGHDGALSTVHASSCEDAVRRLETLALMAGVGLPHAAIREQLARGIDLIVHLARGAEGSRQVVAVGEVEPIAGGVGVREVWRREDLWAEP